MLTSIVIATFNKLDYTQQCITSIREYTEPGTYEIIVVDNRSTDGTVEWLQSQPDIRAILNDENFGFPKACNQGIEISTGDNILLLNNDTIVTKDWLINLLTSLYSSPEVGAVGSVTNSCSYGQSIPVTYNSLAEMQAFAAELNKSNPSAWEERLKLIGYCMLIKKSVMDEIGLLDERFTPGNYEDDDISLRIRLAGYKLLLCRDTFIHHYGSVSFRDAPPQYIQLMQNNRQKFHDKWGFDPDQGNNFRLDVCSFVEAPLNAQFRVLEIGCGCGGNLLQIKYRYPSVQLYGTESNVNAASVASRVADIQTGNFEEVAANLPKGFFDWIILSEPVANWTNPESGLTELRNLLQVNGRLITALPNSLHYSKIKPFLLGLTPTRERVGFTVSEAQELFMKTGYSQVNMTALLSPVSDTDRTFIQTLTEAAGIDTQTPYETAEILVSATVETQESDLKSLINRIISQEEPEANVRRLAKQDADEALSLIEQAGSGQEEALLNYLAVQLLEYGESKVAQQYLQYSFERNPADPQTIFNMGLACYLQGHSGMALEWFELLPEKNEQVETWIEKINRELIEEKYEKHRIRFLLRRIEQDLDGERCLEELLQRLQDQSVTVEEIEKEVQAGIVEKARVLTALAVGCFHLEVFDPIFVLFEAALRFEPSNAFALYHAASILHAFGENESALTYIERISQPDPSAVELMLAIRGQLR